MARTVSLLEGTLESAVITPSKETQIKRKSDETWKIKTGLEGLLLILASVSVGLAQYPGYLLNPRSEEQPEYKKPLAVRHKEESPANPIPSRKDLYGDPLPSGALVRLGAVRFRSLNRNDTSEIVFTPDSKAVGLLLIGKMPRLWDLKAGELIRQYGKGLRGRPHAGSWLASDGRRMAYTHESNTPGGRRTIQYRVQEVATGELLRSFDVPYGQGFHRCVLSTDGTRLAGHFDGKLRLMNIATGKCIWDQKLEKNDIPSFRSLLFSPDDAYVAVVYERSGQSKDSNNNVELRDAQSGKVMRTLGHPWTLEKNGSYVSFSPDSQTVMVVYAAAVGRQSPSVYLWDVASGKERWHLEKNNHTYDGPSFSPDGKIIAIRDFSLAHREIGLYETATGKKLGSCQQDNAALFTYPSDFLVFSPDGRILASMDRSVIHCWDVATGKRLVLPSFGHESSVSSVVFAADGRTVISCGDNHAVHIWDSLTSQKQRTLSAESSLRPAKTFCLSGWGGASVVSSADGKIVAEARHEIPQLDEKKLSSLSPDQIGETLVASNRVRIYLWDAATGRELRQIDVNAAQGPLRFRNLKSAKEPLHMHKLALSPDGKFIAAGLIVPGNVNIALLWEVATGKQINTGMDGGNPTFSADSKLLMTNENKKFIFWEPETFRELSVVDGVKFTLWPRLTLTPDWQTFLGISSDRWYLNSLQVDKKSRVSFGRPRYLDVATRTPPQQIAVSPNGKMMAWVESDGIIHVVEITTGEERARFQGHNGTVTSLAFSPDSRRLASSSADTTILVWDVTGGRLDDQGHLRAAQASDAQMQHLWDDLAGADAAQASRAIWTLAAASKQTVPFLTKCLHPISNEQASPQRIAQLIAELGDLNAEVREKAAVGLAKLGEAAEKDLRQALAKQASAEVRRGLEQLLESIEAEHENKGPSGDVLRSVRAIESLEQMGTLEAHQLLETLSQGAPDVRQTREAQAALRRLRQPAKQ